MRPACVVGLALVGAALLAAPASAHNVRVTPKVGDAATVFVFKGTKWNPGGDVLAEYYASGDANQPFNTIVLLTRRNGTFRMTLRRPVASAAFGLDARVCFTQNDARVGRTFRKCKRIYVEPPTARFWPSAGPPGTSFLLMTKGWYPGTSLTLELTRPDGVVETYTDMSPARSRGAYVAFGPPFGSVFVRKGATYRLFPGDTGVQVGDYLAVVSQANGQGAEIRTLVTVTPP
ncbi:MAG: hypothetical protein ACRDJY_05895 [Thermoleophilaceae bacterium]